MASQQDSTSTSSSPSNGENALKIKRMYLQLEKESATEDDSRGTKQYQLMVEPGGATSRSQSRTATVQDDNGLLAPIFETFRSASTSSHKWSRKKAVGTRSGYESPMFSSYWWAHPSEASSPSGMSLDPRYKVRSKSRNGKPTKAWWHAHARWIGSGQNQESYLCRDMVGIGQEKSEDDDFDQSCKTPPSVDEPLTPDSAMATPQPSPLSNRRTYARGSIRNSMVGSMDNDGQRGRSKSQRWHGSPLTQEEDKDRNKGTMLEWRGGVLVPQTPQERLKEDAKLMCKKMQDSMMGSFDREAWDVCGGQPKVKVNVKDRPDITFMASADNKQFMRNLNRRKTAIGPQSEMEKDELMIASLAKKTGMTVLDVEEFWEVFQKYDLDGEGRINVDGPAFELLILELGQDPKTTEVIKMREDLDISVDGCADFVDFYLVFMQYLSTQRKL